MQYLFIIFGYLAGAIPFGLLYGRLVGVDVSEEAVKQGHELFPELEIIKIQESRSLPFDDAAFDSVTVLDVLEHVYEQAELLAEVNRVLKDGGKLIIPLASPAGFQTLTLITKKGEDLETRFITGVIFVPMTGEAQT